MDGYEATPDGRIFKYGIEVSYHRANGNRAKFVRISGGNNAISINVAKLVLLAFDKKGYKEGMVAVRMDGDENNDSLNNLIWGTRTTASQMAATRNPERFRNLHKHRKNHKELDYSLIKRLWKEEKDYKEIMEETGASVSTVYKYKPNEVDTHIHNA